MVTVLVVAAGVVVATVEVRVIVVAAAEVAAEVVTEVVLSNTSNQYTTCT